MLSNSYELILKQVFKAFGFSYCRGIFRRGPLHIPDFQSKILKLVWPILLMITKSFTRGQFWFNDCKSES